MRHQVIIGKYRGTSMDRKPGLEMFLDLMERWKLCPDWCLMFGEQSSDITVAHAAGVEGLTVGTASPA